MMIGLVLVVAALVLVAHNMLDDQSAKREAGSLLSQAKTIIDKGQADYLTDLESLPDYMRNPDMEMPTSIIDGHVCVGLIQFPTLDLELPVVSEFSYDELEYSPCRFFGSPYTGNLVICAHNYDSHFRRIRNLEDGAPVIFVDMDGNIFNYEVGLIEVLRPIDVEEMCNSEWDLSLFTCTFDSASRVTVRCLSSDSDIIIQDLD